MTLTGVPIEPLKPGQPEWLKVMSASKVAAVLGLSPYDSRFSLYYRMRDGIGADIESDEMRRGHYLEPAIAQWFADQHPEWQVLIGGCWRHPDIDWYTAAPDGLIASAGSDEDVLAGLEIKTDAAGEDWGEPGTDQVPVHVRAQVMSQMDVVGTRRTYVAMLTPFLDFREYVVDYDETDATEIREQCAAFMQQLDLGIRPNLDEHAATYRTIRMLHPDIDPVDVEITPDLAQRYADACDAVKTAEAVKRGVTSELLDVLGNARRAMCLGEAIAIRVAVGAAAPHLRPAKARTRSAA